MIFNKDNKLITCALSPDLSKALDCVNLNNLEFFLLWSKRNTLKLLASYLDNLVSVY